MLHAKAVVVDDEAVFVTSANLTEAALDSNIELGLLVRDRALAASVSTHFQGLIDQRAAGADARCLEGMSHRGSWTQGQGVNVPIMTPDLLLEAVEALEEEPGALVSAIDIMAWSDDHDVDYGPPVNSHFWNSDLEEARGRHRLLKFKTAATKNARNYFTRRLKAPLAPAGAEGHPGRVVARANGWVECVWRDPWDWQNAQVPAP